MIVLVSVYVWPKASFDGEIRITIGFGHKEKCLMKLEHKMINKKESCETGFMVSEKHFQLEIYPKSDQKSTQKPTDDIETASMTILNSTNAHNTQCGSLFEK